MDSACRCFLRTAYWVATLQSIDIEGIYLKHLFLLDVFTSTTKNRSVFFSRIVRDVSPAGQGLRFVPNASGSGHELTRVLQEPSSVPGTRILGNCHRPMVGPVIIDLGRVLNNTPNFADRAVACSWSLRQPGRRASYCRSTTRAGKKHRPGFILFLARIHCLRSTRMPACSYNI